MEAHPVNPPNILQDLPADERPRERLQNYGAASLRSDELIAILLRTGFGGRDVMRVSLDLLDRFGGVGGLARASFDDLVDVPGLGPAKAAELQAAIMLGIRATAASDERRRLLNEPDQVAAFLMKELSILDQEVVVVLSLDTRLYFRKRTDVYRGSVHSTTVRYGELLRDPVRVNATAIVLVHNHPSGDPAPSAADVALTKGLREACKTLEIDFHDHLVIGGGRYVSMRTAGLGF